MSMVTMLLFAPLLGCWLLIGFTSGSAPFDFVIFGLPLAGLGAGILFTLVGCGLAIRYGWRLVWWIVLGWVVFGACLTFTVIRIVGH